MSVIGENVIKLSQSTDYLGFLNKQLRDLRGISTLANELIQNADDVRGSTRIEFDITDSALIVSNDSSFEDCGHARDDHCLKGGEGSRKMCDFHAFRNIASGHKREEQDTTGAFGIGFISVYQITDRPSLKSGSWHWRLFPDYNESERIEARQLSPEFEGTRFELPWAKERTLLRTKLDVDPVPNNIVSQMLEEMPRVLKAAAPFLKQLESLILKQDGKEIFSVTCLRDEGSDEILVAWDGKEQTWLKLRGNFDEEGKQLRQQHRAIEDKRRTEVTVAVPLEALKLGESSDGLFYAALPTEQSIGIPVLINADFFPSTDRKRLLFDGDYQGAWNTAAVEAAARILADNVLKLRDCISPSSLWFLFDKIRKLHQSEKTSANTALASFWDHLRPVIENEEVVFTVRETWQSVDRVRNLLELDKEECIIPFLDILDCNIVHPDLRPFFNLLSECNVSRFTISDLMAGMQRKGLHKVIPEHEIPVWLGNKTNRDILGQEIDRLLQRVKKDERESLIQRLRIYSFVYTDDHELAPPCQIRKALDGEKELFGKIAPDLRWASEDNCPEILERVKGFGTSDAISALSGQGAGRLERICSHDQGVIGKLINWLVSQIECAAIDGSTMERIRRLKIWPSSGSLKPLSELSVPGNFEDPLQLANLLEMNLIDDRCRYVLINSLGAEELTLSNYVTQHIPLAFNEQDGPKPELRRKLVKLLSIHVGELSDSDAAVNALRGCQLIECRDGEFRKPAQVCFYNEDVVSMLGNTAPIALIPAENREAVSGLFRRLGVSDFPSTVAIIDRVESLTQEPLVEASRQAVENIISGIASYWEELEEDADQLEELREIAWLPARSCNDWLKPSEIYSNFTSYLFDTQARFLNINRTVENRAAEFLKFISVESEPSLKQVIDHLLEMAGRKNAKLNSEVYTFLNRHADEPLILSLRNKPCILLEGGRYVAPSHVFWGAHPFGQYRERLMESWRKHSTLLNRIGVSEEPDEEDAINVLIELSDKFGEYNAPLGEDDKNIALSCWQILSRNIDDEDADIDLSRIQERKVVPDAYAILSLPSSVFFEDRPRLAKRFGTQLERHIIKRPADAWRAMLNAGVLQLSEAVEIELVECNAPQESTAWASFIQSRMPSFARVLSANDELNIDSEILNQMHFMEVDSLVLSYKLNFMHRTHHGEQEQVLAYWHKQSNSLYVARGGKSSGEMARELAFAVCPDGSASQLASGFKEVLIADSIEEAEQSLDELGFPPGEQEIGQVAGGSEFGMGGSESGEEWMPPSPLPPKPPTANDESSDVPPHAGSADAPTNPNEGGTQGGRSGSHRGGRRSGTGGASTCGRSRSDKVSRRIKQKSRRRMVSYLEPKEADAEQNDHNREAAESEAKRIGDIAEAFVLQHEVSSGKQAHRMPVNNPGYDIESIDPQTGEVSYIEVKGTDGLWDDMGVAITHTQYLKAKDMGDSYWLYVVEEALSDSPRIFKVKNPVNQINSYYFDKNWKGIAGAEGNSEFLDEPSLDELVEQLKACTDGVFVDIIDYCDQNDLPLPVVGYELMNDAGEVTDEELELAWPDLKVGIYASDDFDASTYDGQGWRLFNRDMVNELDVLRRVLNEEAYE